MSRRAERVAVLAALVVAAPCAAQQGAAPHFQLPADTVLVDDVVPIRLGGLAPGAAVTVTLTGAGPVRGWSSRAMFRADAAGRVDATRDAPVSGDYSGVHAMGLFWSARRDSSAQPLARAVLRTPDADVPPPQPWVLSASAEGRVLATDTVWRRALDPGVRFVPVRDSGLAGTLYLPPGAGREPGPAVIVLGGSLGGIPVPELGAGGLASHGYVVLALGYFAADGLPPRLVNVPLEYFGTAIRWLARQPGVDPARIGVVGTSCGGELALLLGATYPALHAVVAYAPSNVLWAGTVTDATRAPAWTLGGKSLPWMRRTESREAVRRHAGCPNGPECAAPFTRRIFEALLEDSAAVAAAEIPVERIQGPVLLVSGRSDGLWPSTPMAERVVARLRAHGFPYPVEHLAYPDAGHSIGRPYIATPDVGVARRHPIVPLMTTPGGTPQGTALASEDSWQHVLALLDRALGRR